MLVLIDGDIFRYRCAAAAEHTYYLVELINSSGYVEWKKFDTKKEADQFIKNASTGAVVVSSHIWSRKEVQPVDYALQIVKSSLENALASIGEKYDEKLEVQVFLSGKTNFRELVAKSKPYKGNRDDTTKPAHFKEVGAYLVDVWNARTTEGYEADDAIGIWAMDAKTEGRKHIVVSNDKDLDQIPGLHYDWVAKEFYDVSPKEAKSQFYTQLLTGDTTDNIPGLPGIGPAKAKAALAECKTPGEMLEKCMDLYGKSTPDGIKPVDYIREMADLVYILKKPNEPWTKTKEGKEFVAKYSVG